ncbi:stimulated by retinoic acid gene 6 protein-like [Haliotis rubra]|uniref:stimulated by retinoic acid gene 6 protein-like n=1 Tax=Haliotis rubra TaxID=36100 RepID=UPI001EE53E9F|nr:stimulated by retinoic acid gene 6 protein-like [Haliotis rubra]
MSDDTGSDISFNYDDFTHYTVIPAVVIILLLAFLEKRKSGRGIYDGGPALIVPLNLLDGYENRFAFAAAFGAVTNEILSLFLETQYSFEYPLWAFALILQVRTVEVAVVCFPLFACIATRHRLVGSVCGLLYSILLCGGILTDLVQRVRLSAGTSTVFELSPIATDVPVLLCYMYLLVRSASEIIRAVSSKVYSLQEETDTVRPHQTLHVRLLLSGYYDTVLRKDETFRQTVTYRSILGFRYPVKIVCAVFIVAVILYQLAVLEITGGVVLWEIKEHFLNFESIDAFNHTIVLLTPQAVNGMIGKTFCVCTRGDRSFICETEQHTQYIMASNLRFLGYLIAYSIWGAVIFLVFLLIFGLVVFYAMFWMEANGILWTFFLYVVQLLSLPATALILFYIQVAMARYVLLQDKIRPTDEDPPLNVDNRRFYEGFNFFSLFGSLTIGIFSCFLRILTGTVMGVVMVGRLDKTTYMRSMERRDKGHFSYISMLHVENSHNHPVVRVFCGILWDQTLQRRHATSSTLLKKTTLKYRTFPSVEPPEDEIGDNSGRKPRRQISALENTRNVRKWKLAFTLLRNPDLRKQRKTFYPMVDTKPKKLRQ